MQSSGGDHPAKIFNAIMSTALQDIKVSSFEIPKGYKEDRKKDKPEKEEKESKEDRKKREKEEKKKDKDKKPGKGKGK